MKDSTKRRTWSTRRAHAKELARKKTGQESSPQFTVIGEQTKNLRQVSCEHFYLPVQERRLIGLFCSLPRLTPALAADLR